MLFDTLLVDPRTRESIDLVCISTGSFTCKIFPKKSEIHPQIPMNGITFLVHIYARINSNHFIIIIYTSKQIISRIMELGSTVWVCSLQTEKKTRTNKVSSRAPSSPPRVCAAPGTC